MPKATKKKKEKVADFSKSKLKLGKGKSVPTNAIDTSFKARSIALPSQSIAVEKDTSQPITKRQLTFADLLSHLKHYNAGTRKDAILGLRELLDSNWDLLMACLTTLFNALVRLIADEDAGVRKQLLSFTGWLFPRIPIEDIIPHAPSLLLFTTSAQTHIFPEIRIDAIRFLDILLEYIPESVVSGWCDTTEGHGGRVLGGYLGILNAGTKYGETEGPLKATSTASVVLTLGSKLVVLRSLSVFLKEAISSLNTAAPSQKKKPSTKASTHFDASFMKNAFSSLTGYHSFENIFTSQPFPRSICRDWTSRVEGSSEDRDIFTQSFPLLDNPGEQWTLSNFERIDISLVDENTSSSRSSTANFIAHLAATLHSTIIETYLDCTPSVFSPGSTPSEVEVQLIVTVVRMTQSLYHAMLEAPEDVDQEHISRLESIVNYMATYFPASSRDGKLEPSYEEFNIIFCELTSLTVNALQIKTSLSHSRLKHHMKVTQYIIHRLRGEAGSTNQVGVAINPTAYRALLPTIWALVNASSSSSAGTGHSDELIHAVLDHAIKTSSKSTCKRLTVEFVARLMLLSLELHYQDAMSAEKDHTVKAKFDAWFLHLPQVLWELGNSNLPNSETILRVLLRVLQRRSKLAQQGQQSEAITSLQSRLVPYFHIDHPTRGALPGPYSKLPVLPASRLRLLVLDVAITLLDLGKQEGQELGSLSRAVGLAVAGEGEQGYWSHLSALHTKIN